MKEEEVLEKLLTNIQNNNPKSKMCPKEFNEKHPNKANYYFENYEDNFYKSCISEKMKKKINKNHARAIYNSAVMIYNLLGEKVEWDGKNYTVEYEKELPVIKDNTGKDHIAHLDFFMECDDNILFGEAKMIEWFGSPKYLKKAYLIEESYEKDDEKIFIKKFDEFIIRDDDGTRHEVKSGYKSIYTKYDAFQMLIHILGIYKFIKSKEYNGKKDIKLINVVWGNDSIEAYQKEKKEANDFIKKANEIFKQIFEDYGVNFKIEYYNYNEFKKKITFTDKNRENYLDRYNI